MARQNRKSCIPSCTNLLTKMIMRTVPADLRTVPADSRSHVDGTEKTLNTAGWKSGVYIIKATVGDQVQTQKLSVKK